MDRDDVRQSLRVIQEVTEEVKADMAEASANAFASDSYTISYKYLGLFPMKETQVEISVADGFVLGVKPPVRESGQLEDTPGIEIIGPKGSVKKERGVIAALRHIHMTPDIARRLGYRDGQYVQTRIEGLRGALLCNVLVRVSESYALEMHIDVEEANALGVKTGDRAFFLED